MYITACLLLLNVLLMNMTGALCLENTVLSYKFTLLYKTLVASLI